MNSFIYNNANARDLGILRIVIYGLWLVLIVFTPLTNYSYLPLEIFEPLGIFRVIFPSAESVATNILLTYPFLFGLKTLLLLGCFLCMIGIRPFRWFAIPTVTLLFLSDGIIKGFNGFVNHAEFGILYGALIISFFPASDGYSVLNADYDNRAKKNYLLPIFLVPFTLCLTYSFVGISRFLRGGLEIFYGNTFMIDLLVNSSEYTKYGFNAGLYVANSDVFLTLFKGGFFVITIFEVLSPLVLVNRYLRYSWLAVIIPFHILSLFIMNIFFWENLILIILLFFYIDKKKP